MNINHTGRARAQGLSQQDLALRFPARAAAESRVLFQRGSRPVQPALQAVMLASQRVQLSKQAVNAKSMMVLPPKAAVIATGSVKNPAMPRVLPNVSKLVNSNKPVDFPGSTTSEKMRELLSNPTYKAFLAEMRPILVKKMNVEILDFLQDLKSFRDNPTLDKAVQLKKIYIDSGEDAFEMQCLKASEFLAISSDKAINITTEVRRQFKDDFASCMKSIKNGESLDSSGMMTVFNDTESHIAMLLIRELR